MKKIVSLLLAVAMLVSLMAAPAFATPAPSYEGKTVILYTGGLRGDVDLYPQIKAAKDAYENAGAEVILVDAGNYLQGSAAANTDRGASIYSLMDAAGYDVAAMGLAEFGYTDATTGLPYHGNVTRYYTQAMLQDGTEEITYNVNRDGSITGTLPAREPASFQTVAANVTGSASYSFAPSITITTEAGLTVAFYGVTDPTVADNVQDNFVSVAAPVPAELEADVVVCLSNAGLSGDGWGDILIDVPTGGDAVVGAFVIDNGTGTIAPEAVTLSTADETVSALVSEIKAGAGEVPFTSEVILNGADSANRNYETNLGDLVTDALVWYAETYIDGLDPDLPLVAIQNGGNIDQFIYTGDVTATDLLRALPFSPMGVGVIYLTGEQLLETLEAATQNERCPGFAQVSGLTYTLDLAKDYDAGAAYGSFFEADSINRVTITSVNGQPFDPEATYAVVADNYIMNGSDTYYTMTEARSAGATYLNNGNGRLTRDIVARYVQDVLDGVIGEGYAKPQNRITVLKATFTDVRPSDYYYDAARWAAARGITLGTANETTFSPHLPCDRAQAVTFLWRAAGKPEPETAANPFTDITEGSYYYKAVLWAAEMGITSGTNAAGTIFSPTQPISRAEAVTFLWRFAGEPETAGGNSFRDVPDGLFYSEAVLWAVEHQVTDGTGDGTTFSPYVTCDRAQIVTFLYRHLVG